MDHNTLESQAKNDHSTANECTESIQKASGEESSEGNQTQGVRNVAGAVAPAPGNSHGEVNMEADITVDDVIRAGGLGARDYLNSFLPIAADTTDFEESILDARGYEGPRETIR